MEPPRAIRLPASGPRFTVWASTAVFTIPACNDPITLAAVVMKKMSNASTSPNLQDIQTSGIWSGDRSSPPSRFRTYLQTMARLRFHWDFFGQDAPTTAAHFLEHVDEFCAKEGIIGQRHWVRPTPAFCTATLECDEAFLVVVRDRLRPKRAERVLE